MGSIPYATASDILSLLPSQSEVEDPLRPTTARTSLLDLPPHALRHVVRQIHSPALRQVCKQLREASDATTHFRICMELFSPVRDGSWLPIPHPQLFSAMRRFLSLRHHLTEISVCVNKPNRCTKPHRFVPDQLQRFTQLLGAAPAIPAINKLSLLRGRFGAAMEPLVAQHLLQAFHDQLRSLTLEIDPPFFTVDCLQQFHRLQVLEVRTQVANLDFLIHLPDLRELGVWGTDDTTAAAFSAVPLLEVLHIFVGSYNHCSSRAHGVEVLGHLRTLHFHSDTMTNVSNIGLLTGLKELNLSVGHRVRDLSDLSGLSSLTKFQVLGRKLQNFNMLRGMTALRHLHLGKVDAHIPLSLTRNSLLEELVVEDREITVPDLRNVLRLPCLTSLHLIKCSSAPEAIPFASLGNKVLCVD